MNIKPLALVGLFLAVCIGGCSNANTQGGKPVDSSTAPAATQEEAFSNQDDPKAEIRSQSRQAVLDFVSTNLSSWNVKGMSCERYNQNIFATDADLEKDGRHVVVAFFTEKFFPESGDPYWLAIPVNKFR